MARIDLGAIVDVVMPNAAPESFPLIGLAAAWLYGLAHHGHAAAHCIEGCLTVHHALVEYGIASRVEAVAVKVERAWGEKGPEDFWGLEPRYNVDGTFNGHTVLVVPPAGRFIDPTIQQFPDVPGSARAAFPLISPLPGGDGLGDAPFSVYRNAPDHYLTYLALPESHRQAWHSAKIEAMTDDFRAAGADLAANVFAAMQQEPLREKTAASPYPGAASVALWLGGCRVCR
ncbi:MAG TPA: hypothetical protein VMS64_25990 [Candidatus Methylomirabilis sp.]|nr:hypothetical protein [Candidatus Methylomirabilis sp.]